MDVEDLLKHSGVHRDTLLPAAEAAVDLPGLGVDEADALATSRGFHLVRISPTVEGPYPRAWTFNFDAQRIVAIVVEEVITQVYVG